MFNNTALDVFIGLIFVFLLYSLLATIIHEMIAVRLAFRSKVLEKAILRMLEDGKTTTLFPTVDRIKGVLHLFGLINQLKNKNIAPWFYGHPLIKYLAEDNYYSKPAYLDASNFSKVIIDLLKGFAQSEPSIVQALNNAITAGVIHKLPINISATTADKSNPAIKILRVQNPDLPDPATLATQTVPINTNTALFLRSLWQESGADVDKFRVKLEQWFDDTMERATGWYKRYTQFVLFIIGMIMAVVFNVDTIAIHRILSKDKSAREQLVQMAINNKDELGRIANSQTQNDTLLRNTYNLVLDDAKAADQVIGLGRPWTDSCKQCALFNDASKAALFSARLDSLKSVKVNIDNAIQQSLVVNRRLDSLHRRSDSLKALNRRADSIVIESLALQLGKADSTKKANNYLTTTSDAAALTDSISAMTVMATRCPYILAQTRGKWFKYSPNQNGGWETLFGWIITALAISLGAPFWFDLLNKLVKLRGTGAKITTETKDASTSRKATATDAPAPVNINVNTNKDEEAVG